MSSRKQWLFLSLAVLGTVVPLTALAPFVLAKGLSLKLFIDVLWQTPVSRFFALDVLISALTLFLFVHLEGRRLRMANLWVYVVCTLLVGVSLGLPLFLFFRELKLKEATRGSVP
jgi:Protein of unknown function DUF2834